MASNDSGAPEQINIGGYIPALVWRGVGDGARPVVIHIHGGGGSKWDVHDPIIDRVRSLGVTLLSFDLNNHGDRRSSDAERRRFTAGEYVARLEDSVGELHTIIDHVRRDSAMDEARIALRGYSLSATIALVAVGMDIPVQACLSVSGWGDLAAGLAHTAHRLEVPSERIAEELLDARERLMHISPLHRVDAFPPRPIMMIHGLHDVLAPYSAHFALYEALLPYYRNGSGDCLFVAHADGHWTPKSVEEMGMSWLAQQLVSSAPRGVSSEH